MKKKTRIKVNWSEAFLPLLILVFSLSYLYQTIHIKLKSLALSLPVLTILLVFSVQLIYKCIIFEQKDFNVQKKQTLFPFFLMAVQNLLKNKQLKLLFILLSSILIINSIFGFAIFAFLFTLLCLLSFGIRKPLVVIGISVFMACLIYFVFIKLIYVPLPAGIIWSYMQ